MSLVSKCVNCSPEQKYFISLLIVFIIYYFFNIREQNYLSINMPREKMSNVSIFNNNF
jgi:hypothetical protein